MLNKLLPSLAIGLLVSCSSTEHHQLIVAPSLIGKLPESYQQLAKLATVDLRAQSHLVQIQRAGEAAKLYSSQTGLTDVLQPLLTQAFEQQGLQFTDDAPVKIKLAIDKALITVNQDLMRYSANNHIVLRFIIDKAEQTLTKSFSSNGSSEGPLTADIAVLERDFNQQLSNLLMQALTDAEIQSFIR